MEVPPLWRLSATEEGIDQISAPWGWWIGGLAAVEGVRAPGGIAKSSGIAQRIKRLGHSTSGE